MKTFLTRKPDGVVLTQAQVHVIDSYAPVFSGDKARFLNQHHQQLERSGWQGDAEQVLNNLSVDQLGRALYCGYQPEPASKYLTERTNGQPLTVAQLNAIERWFDVFNKDGVDKPFFVKKHQSVMHFGGWDYDKAKPLNDLSADQIGVAVFYGFTLITEGEDIA